MKKMVVLALGLLCVSNVAMAASWTENGDAGDLPGSAQVPQGSGALDSISGTIGANTDADMYCISVPTSGGFVATTCGGATIDTQLWIFAEDGTGISFDDDDPAGCGLQSTLTGTFLPGPGQYLIAISSYSNDALNAGGNEIWADSPFATERTPDGPGAGDPVIASWNGAGSSSGAYTIFLSGAEFCGQPTPTIERSWGQIKSIYK
ncbi:MAG: DVUA0089 family protein [Candidatus Eisenbacteria bacterium]|nr:DVUA0089 family protein [Candidatus Eisenbacteria bacterium]